MGAMVTIVLWVALWVFAPLALAVHAAIQDRPWRVTLVLLLFLLLALLGVGSPYSFLHALLLWIAWGFWRQAEGRPRVMIAIALVLTAVVYAWPLWHTVSLMQNGQRLRAEYPLESISDRLAYEPPGPPLADESPQTAVPLAPAVESELADLEDEWEWPRRSRTRVLEQIHNATFYRFVIADGFGLTRLSTIGNWKLEDPSSEPIPIPSTTLPEYDLDNPPLDAPITFRADVAKTPSWRNEMHWEGVTNFLDPERMGYVKSRDEVAGFLPHGFHQKYEPMHQLEASSVWRITRLQLVSLLKHETPVVYVSDYLPQMEQLAEAETRPLNEFEQAALAQLRTEEDLVIDEGENHIRMLGAIRAGTSCLECHNVQRGELLGAFSYELRQHAIP